MASLAAVTLADWLARRTYAGAEFSPAGLRAAKAGRTLSVVLPAKDVADTIGGVLDVLVPLRAAGVIDELVVVDAASEDGTGAVAAARDVPVHQEDALMAAFGPCLGKGDAMWRALSATRGDVVAFVDADTGDFTEGFAVGLLGPALAHPDLALVKGAYRRPFRAGGHVEPDGGGRVTELVARPLINLHRPELAGFEQPLAGEIVARRDLLEALAFPVGYGVEIAMLLDAHARAGLDALAQVRIGTRQNAHQPLRALAPMAYAVLVAASRRLGGNAAEPGPLVLPHGGTLDVREVAVAERPPLRIVRAA